MASTNLNWRERLSPLEFQCQVCGRKIVPVTIDVTTMSGTKRVTSWGHTEIARGIHIAKPALNTLGNDAIERLGWRNGTDGALAEENPFFPGGPLHDGASTVRAAAGWTRGWETSKHKKKTKKKQRVVETEGLDYLEEPRL